MVGNSIAKAAWLQAGLRFYVSIKQVSQLVACARMRSACTPPTLTAAVAFPRGRKAAWRFASRRNPKHLPALLCGLASLSSALISNHAHCLENGTAAAIEKMIFAIPKKFLSQSPNFNWQGASLRARRARFAKKRRARSDAPYHRNAELTLTPASTARGIHG